MSTDVIKAIELEFKNRIDSIEILFNAAKKTLKTGEYLQCAVRIEELKGLCSFTEFEMRIFEIASRE